MHLLLRFARHRGAISLNKTRLFRTCASRGFAETTKGEERSSSKAAIDAETLLKRLPPKPEPPEEGSCCLTGCEYCVWDLYDEDMHEYQEQAKAIRKAFEEQGKPVPNQLKDSHLRDSIDPSMRAFLDMERELAMKAQDEMDDDDD